MVAFDCCETVLEGPCYSNFHSYRSYRLYELILWRRVLNYKRDTPLLSMPYVIRHPPAGRGSLLAACGKSFG